MSQEMIDSVIERSDVSEHTERDSESERGPDHGAPIGAAEPPSATSAPERDGQRKSTNSGKSANLSRRLLIVGVIVVVAIGFSAIQRGRLVASTDAPAESPSARPLIVQAVRAGAVSPPRLARSFAGLLQPERESQLSFERAGRILDLRKHEGDTVATDEVIAALDQENLDAAEERVESELAASEALLSELRTGPRKQTIEAARARVQQLTAEVQLAKLDSKRQSDLMDSRATSRREYDAARLGLEATERGLAAESARLDELVEGTRAERIAAQQANQSAIVASLKEITAQRHDSRIKAPFAGRIQSRLVDEGVVVSPGTPVFHLVSHQTEARFGLPPVMARELTVDQPVVVSLRGEERAGWIDRIEPTIDRETRTRGVFIRFTEARQTDAPVEDEMQAAGWVAGEVVDLLTDETTAPTDAHWLPAAALVRGERGLQSVYVVPGDSPTAVCERRLVELLKIEGDKMLVQGMLEPGERVIAGGLHRITAGMTVETTSWETE